MGTTAKQTAAMAVASRRFVVAFANNLATMCLSVFRAMSCSWPPDRMSQGPGLRSNRQGVCDRNHKLGRIARGYGAELKVERKKNEQQETAMNCVSASRCLTSQLGLRNGESP